jgi:hypothetical protein
MFRVSAASRILLVGCLCGASACVVDTPVSEALPRQAIQLGPWLMDVGPTQITVAWTTLRPTVGKIRYTSQEGLTARAAESLATTDHRMLLSSLVAGTRYRFTILGDVPASGSFTTAPDPAGDASAQAFRVLVYGDNRTNGGDHALVVNAAQAEHAELALHTGDMVVNAKDQRAWARWFEVERELLASTPILPTMGNHEITDLGVTYSRYFKQPGGLPYHSVDYGNVHVQVIDSFEIQAGADPHAGAVSEAQKQWAAADAKAVPQDHHLWLLVHQGPQTHPRDMRLGHGGLTGVRDMIAGIQKVHPVEVVFAGHEHFYERGELAGLHYFVIGGGGAPLEDPNPAGEGVKLAVKALSFVTLEVCGCHVTGKARGITGKVFDSFTLSDCPKPCSARLADPLEVVAVPTVGAPMIAVPTNLPDAGP